MRIRIFHISQKHFAEKLPVKDIDTHGRKVALRMFRFLLKLYNVTLFVCIHNTETACFLHGNLNNRDGGIGVHFFMISKHFCVIHLIDMVAGKDQDIFRRILINKIDILRNSVCRTPVYVKVGVCFLTGRKYENAAFSCVKTPASACSHITVQKHRFILGKYAYDVDPTVGTVAQREVNDAVFAAV